MAAGKVDGGRARSIWYYTRFLSDADAIQVEVLLSGDGQLVHMGDRVGRDGRARVDGQGGHRARWAERQR